MVAVRQSGGECNGTLYRSGLSVVPSRGHEAVPERGTLLHGEVRDREAQLSTGAAWQDAEGEARRIRPAAAREAEGQAHLRCARGPVPRLLRDGRADAWDHRRGAPAIARAAPRQRGLPSRPVDVAAAGAPARP